MIPATRNLNVTSTLQGEKIGMTIDPDSLVHVMGLLTDLYSNPEMAVLREYSTNAYDAHIAAGCPLPIEVSLPTSLSPYLKIRDYGDGLDVDDIRNIYSRYGTSTKRESNDAVGSLGLGCKSALTYTDQFTLSGIKNGRAIQAAISREEDGSSAFTIVSEYATDEPSGVEIVIPVNTRNDFTNLADYLFQFWAEGTVVVNGEEPTQITGIELDSEIIAVSNDKLDQSVIVMGGVPYPFSHEFNFQIVATVPIGAVSFTPSREALQMNAQTTAVVEDIIERVKVGKQIAAQEMVNSATSKPEALRLALKATGLFSNLDDLTFNDEQIPTAFDADLVAKEKAKAAGEEYDNWGVEPYRLVKLTRSYSRRSRYGSDSETSRRYPISIVTKTIFFTGFEAEKLTAHFRKKLDAWWGNNRQSFIDAGYQVEHVFLHDTDLPNVDWIDPMLVCDWADVAATKLPSQGREDGRPSGSYRATDKDGLRVTVLAEDIDPDGPIFYYDHNSYPTAQIKLIRDRHKDAIFVELMTNRVGKFTRLFPNAREVRRYTRELAEKWLKGLSKKNRIAIFVKENHTGGYQTLNDLDATKIDDPDLKLAVELLTYDLPTKVKNSYQKYQSYVTVDADWTNPADNYPLLALYLENYFGYGEGVDDLKATALDHLYIYLNAAYAAGRSI